MHPHTRDAIFTRGKIEIRQTVHREKFRPKIDAYVTTLAQLFALCGVRLGLVMVLRRNCDESLSFVIKRSVNEKYGARQVNNKQVILLVILQALDNFKKIIVIIKNDYKCVCLDNNRGGS